MPALPLVSVFIPTRNRSALLTRALASIWNQDRSDVEIIVVDDASDDETPALLERWALENKLRWYRNEHPRGACAARNLAIRQSRGKYVTGLDDDDEMLPGRLTTMLLSLRPDLAFVCSAHIAVDPDGKQHYRPCAIDIDLPQILARNVASTFFAEREKVIACGGFDESLPAGQDYDLWIRMIKRFGPAQGIAKPLQLVNEAAWGRISTSPRRKTGYWMVYRKHKASMDERARAIHLYNLHKACGKKLGLRNAWSFFVAGNRLRVTSRVVSERIPILASSIQRAAEHYARAITR